MDQDSSLCDSVERLILEVGAHGECHKGPVHNDNVIPKHRLGVVAHESWSSMPLMCPQQFVLSNV